MKPVPLYATCRACEGHGRLAAQPGGPRTQLCAECRGKGRITTADGRSIMDLLRPSGLMDLAPDE